MRVTRNQLLRPWTLLTVSAVASLLVRLPFLPPRLEDIDSINFDLGIHDFNPIAHQPHPPGYPIFILFGKIGHAFLTSHAAALGVVSAVASSLSVIPLYFLMREFTSRAGAGLVCLLTLANPLIWLNSVRPMSDMAGFFAAVTSQCLLVKGTRGLDRGAPRAQALWWLGVIVAGLSIGVRLQALFLVGPILLYGWIRHRSVRAGTLGWLAAAVGVWVVPLVWLSGGPALYVQSFLRLVSDALPAEPLVVQFTVRRAVFALLDVLVSPWLTVWLAGPVLVLAAAGAIRWLRSDWRAFGIALILFLPYGLYNYFVQMTATIRYGIPLVPLVALLSTVALLQSRRLQPIIAATAGIAFVLCSGLLTLPALGAYHAAASPVAQALDYIRETPDPGSFIVSGNYMFDRYLPRLGPGFEVRFPRLHEDLRPVFDYWKEGGRKPVLFLRNPMRMSLLRVGRDSQKLLHRWNWPAPLEPLMKGERPATVEVWQIDPPRWFTDTGFLVTPEAGAPDEVARQDHVFYVRPGGRPRSLIASGSIPGGHEADVSLQMGDAVLDSWRIQGDFTLRTMVTPLLETTEYVPLKFVTKAPILFTDLWVERTDQPAIRPARGFYIPEHDNRARLFRWIGPEAEAAAYIPVERARLSIRGQIPVAYYQLPVTLSLVWNDAPLTSFEITSAEFAFDYTLTAPAGNAWGTLTLRSSQSFVPDVRQRNGDRRRLAVRIDALSVTALPAATPTDGGG